MKIHKIETVTRYQIRFTPAETETLLADHKWRMVLSIEPRRNSRQPSSSMAMLTKTQIVTACEALGIDSRKWFRGPGAQTTRGARARYRAGRGKPVNTGLG